jgi:hypothetical protein
MPTNLPNLGVQSRSKDYWYLDRSRVESTTRLALRAAWVTATAGVMLLGAACCSNKDGSFAQNYAQAYGPEAQRSTSGLLGDTTDALLTTTTDTLTTTTDTLTTTTDTLTTTTDTLTGALDPVTAPLAVSVSASVTLESANLVVTLKSVGEELKDARVVFSTGDLQGFSISGFDARTVFPKQRGFTHIVATGSSGNKWYFDHAGLPLPNGYQPRIAVLAGLNSYTFSSSDAVDEVRFFYSNGNVSSGRPDSRGRVSTLVGSTVSYMAVRLKYSTLSEKWYFDRAGLPLPGGYRPNIVSGWKNQSLALNSSDVYDTVVIFFTDGTRDAYSTSELSGLYKPFRARTPEGFMVRLKSDSSKWYFDNFGTPLPVGSKWFVDVD